MSYLHARAHAERVGAELQMEAWIGEKVFDVPINHVTDENKNLPIRSELDLRPDETNVCIRGYAQRQEAIIYTKTQARAWLKLSHSWSFVMPEGHVLPNYDAVIAHRRVGDYAGPNSHWPIVSERSIVNFVRATPELASREIEIVCPETEDASHLPAELHFLPDFYRLVHSEFLIRGNSSFSWLAALLSNAQHVWSPRIDGLTGGVEHDVRFERGNHCRLGNFDLCSDLHVEP
jgi:hypothetical protein